MHIESFQLSSNSALESHISEKKSLSSKPSFSSFHFVYVFWKIHTFVSKSFKIMLLLSLSVLSVLKIVSSYFPKLISKDRLYFPQLKLNTISKVFIKWHNSWNQNVFDYPRFECFFLNVTQHDAYKLIDSNSFTSRHVILKICKSLGLKMGIQNSTILNPLESAFVFALLHKNVLT